MTELLVPNGMIALSNHEHRVLLELVGMYGDMLLRRAERSGKDQEMGDALEITELYQKLDVLPKTGPRNTTTNYSMRLIIEKMQAGIPIDEGTAVKPPTKNRRSHGQRKRTRRKVRKTR